MGIVQTALANLLSPIVAPLVARIAELEARPGLTDADREALEKAVSLVEEFEAISGGDFSPTPINQDGTVTVPEIQ